MAYTYQDTRKGAPPLPTAPTAPYVGDFDPLLDRLWLVIDHHAQRAGIDRASAAVMLANSEMPRSGL